MKAVKVILILLFVGMNVNAQDLWEDPALPTVNTPAEKAQALSLLWSEIKYNFVGIDQVKFDIDKFYFESMERVLATTNDIDFYRELRRFIGAFNDGHTEIFAGVGQVPYNPDRYTDTWSVLFTAYGKHLYVQTVRDDYRELMGAELISVRGIPIEKYMKKYVLPLCSGSNDECKWSYAAHKHIIGRGYKGRPQEVKFKTVDGKIIKYEYFNFDRIVGYRENTKFIRLYEIAKIEEPTYPVDLKWKDNDIAIINIDSFWEEDIDKLEDKICDAMETASKKAKGLILDLRNNSGGATSVAQLVQMFIDPADSILTFGAITRVNNGYGRAQGNYREKYKDFYNYCAFDTIGQPAWIPRYSDVQPLNCPVVILIGPDTQSACEDLLINLYELPNRPKLVGLQTAGTTGAPLVIELPHKVDARICTLRPLFPYSKKPFLEPIQPDVNVPFDMKAYINGQDVTLEKGIEVLQKEIKKANKAS